MKISKDNPLLTAYALGELDAGESAEVEAALRADASLAAEVEAIRAVAAELEADLAAEATPKLLPIQRQRLLRQAAQMQRPGRTAPAPRAAVLTLRRRLLAAAAALLLLGGLAGLWMLRGPGGRPTDTPIAGGAANQPTGGGVEYLAALSPYEPDFASSTPRPTEKVDFFDLSRPTVGSLALTESGEAIGPAKGADGLSENPFRLAARRPRSTFGMAVDISSYLHVQQLIFEETRLPDPADVRIEEMVNYFPYDYPGPDDSGDALAVRADLARCPWSPGHVLLRVAVRARADGGEVVARDATAAVEFDPAAVASWRLIGFDGPLTAAGARGAEAGPNSSLTALYELVLTDSAEAGPDRPIGAARVDYRLPGEESVRSAITRCGSSSVAFEDADADFRFAVAVAGFGMILRNSPHRGSWTAADVVEQAEAAVGDDPLGRRGMFISVLREARQALLPAQ